MGEPPADRIHIRRMRLRCVIGVHPEERRARQEVVVDLAEVQRINEMNRRNMERMTRPPRPPQPHVPGQPPRP